MIATLDRQHWDVLITFSDEPPPTIEAHYAFATVQLTRRDGAEVLELAPGQYFCVGRAEYRVLEVLQREGSCVVLRCAMRPITQV